MGGCQNYGERKLKNILNSISQAFKCHMGADCNRESKNSTNNRSKITSDSFAKS